MKINEPKFCKTCQEMVYSLYCPFCERPVRNSVADAEDCFDDSSFDTPEVDEGQGWGEDSNALREDDMGVVSLDDIFGVDSD
jgi:hypothetical protein